MVLSTKTVYTRDLLVRTIGYTEQGQFCTDNFASDLSLKCTSLVLFYQIQYDTAAGLIAQLHQPPGLDLRPRLSRGPRLRDGELSLLPHTARRGPARAL